MRNGDRNPEGLRGFIRHLEERDELHRIEAEVDPDLEIAEITDRVCKSPGGGTGLFFENVKGHDFPVLTNLFGSFRRTAWALGVEELDFLEGRLTEELARASGENAAARLRSLVETPSFLPRLVERAPCREIVSDPPDLGILPALRSWPGDGGRFLTLPMVFTRDPETGRVNCGMYRMQLFGDRTAAIHWSEGSGGGRHCAAYRKRGLRMPVAVALGGDPALLYAAGAPLPVSVDEAAFAGYLRRRPVELVRCLRSDLAVPAGAEFVLEGVIEPEELRTEGPFGNHTGYYAPPAPSPVFHLSTLTRRRDALYPCTVVGRPPMEDCFLAKATERLFLPLLRFDFPEIVDLNLPMETIFHGCALLSVRREGAARARELIRALWRGGLLRSSRLLVVLDEGVDIRNLSESFWRAVNHVDAGRDVILDGARIGIDATRKDDRKPLEADPGTRRLVDARWNEYGIGRKKEV